jgi:hypothetical protein
MSLADEALFVAGAGSLFREGRSFAWNLFPSRRTQFSYFDQLLERPIWKGRKVLDLGGNVGTFLVGAGDDVDHDDYWCSESRCSRARPPHLLAGLISYTITAIAYSTIRTGLAICPSRTVG